MRILESTLALVALAVVSTLPSLANAEGEPPPAWLVDESKLPIEPLPGA